MRNRMKFKKIALLLIVLAATVSCVHEWPVPAPANVILHLNFEGELPQGPTMDFTTKADAPDNYDLRYIIEVYPETGDGKYDQDTPYARYVYSKADISSLDSTITLNIMEGKYLFRVWADYVDNGSLEDKYYNADRFKYVKLLGRNENLPHTANTDYRDAFTGYTEIEVIRFGPKHPPVEGRIKMKRPVSKVVIITTDLDIWKTKVLVNMYESMLQGSKAGETGNVELPTTVNLDDYVVKIHYPIYMPNAYNLIEDNTAWSDQDVTFESKLIQLNKEEASMGFDYVFAKPIDPRVDIAVSLHTKDGVQLARSQNMTIILEQGKVTTVKGSFLLEKSDGGVSINPDFEGEFNITI